MIGLEELLSMQSEEKSFITRVGQPVSTITYRVNGLRYVRQLEVPAEAVDTWIYAIHTSSGTYYGSRLNPRELRNFHRQTKTYQFVVLDNERGLAASDSKNLPQGPIRILGIEAFPQFSTVDVVKVSDLVYEAIRNTRRRPREFAAALQLGEFISGTTSKERQAVAIIQAEREEREKEIERLRLLAEKEAYERELRERLATVEGLLRYELNKAGSRYIAHRMVTGGNYHITHQIGGDTFYTTVNTELQVQRYGAGICVAGYDHEFNLFQIVRMIYDGQDRDLIVKTGRP